MAEYRSALVSGHILAKWLNSVGTDAAFCWQHCPRIYVSGSGMVLLAGKEGQGQGDRRGGTGHHHVCELGDQARKCEYVACIFLITSHAQAGTFTCATHNPMGQLLRGSAMMILQYAFSNTCCFPPALQLIATFQHQEPGSCTQPDALWLCCGLNSPQHPFAHC